MQSTSLNCVYYKDDFEMKNIILNWLIRTLFFLFLIDGRN